MTAKDWDVLNPSPERWQLDGMVFDALGLTAGERNAVHEGVFELVSNRQKRAKSLLASPRVVASDRPFFDAVGDVTRARGKAIYKEEIIPKVDEDTQRGKLVAIDVYSGDYEIDFDLATAIRRLREHHPGAITYVERIGYPTAFKMGLRGRVRAS